MFRAAILAVVALAVVAAGAHQQRAQADPIEELYKQVILTAREVGTGFVVRAEGPQFTDVPNYRRAFSSRTGTVIVSLFDADSVSVQQVAEVYLSLFDEGLSDDGGFLEVEELRATVGGRSAVKYGFTGTAGDGSTLDGELLAFNTSIITGVIITIDTTPQTVEQYTTTQIRKIQAAIGAPPTPVATPTAAPRTPTPAPRTPTVAPTAAPTVAPTVAPTRVPTATPTRAPLQ